MNLNELINLLVQIFDNRTARRVRREFWRSYKRGGGQSPRWLVLADGAEGQSAWTTPGTHTWTVPNNVFRISAVAVGGGGGGTSARYSTATNTLIAGAGGAGGGLAYKNNIAVTPGQTVTIVVGDGGSQGADGGDSILTVGSISFTAGGGEGGWSVAGTCVCHNGIFIEVYAEAETWEVGDGR